MSGKITRVTLFKIPKAEDQQHLIDLYKQMPQKATKVPPLPPNLFPSNISKDGKPYIVSVQAGKAKADQRSQGFTIVAISTFASQEDFNYYDTQCAAHLELRTFAKSVNEGVAMIYFENEIV
ncbi:stress responsive A B barrel domain-containing protein [Fusarium globosum]|uniref:Stress responsive A B barrel domain-containing protein n=1 Tax=Fusarium globosum TaxID=78864 RepID=A0A8H5YJ44_9HYPO|nr:stress responsive A B barrel domain-containing protein [Fusarium globosum]